MALQFAQDAIMPDGFFAESASEEVMNFVRTFHKTFDRKPEFIEAVAYDTAMILFQMVSSPDIRFRSDLKNKLKNLKIRKGTQMSYAIESFDPEIFQAIENERERQTDHLEMIASENFTIPAVMEAMGSVFTNKYAEGYPFKRYYGGCEYADVVEQIAIDRACELFDCNYANVQPHSGSQANGAVYAALLKAGDIIGLFGNLGAGKTCLTQGIVRGLKANESEGAIPLLAASALLELDLTATPIPRYPASPEKAAPIKIFSEEENGVYKLPILIVKEIPKR